jgi:hypothetical protein
VKIEAVERRFLTPQSISDQIVEMRALFLAPVLGRILLRPPHKRTEEILSQDRTGQGAIDAENMNFSEIPMPNTCRTGVVVKNGWDGVIKMLF